MNIVLFDGDPFFPRNDERCQHIKKVLRKSKGDTFSAGLIDGPEGTATILESDERGIRFEFRAERPMRPLFPVSIIIGFPRPIQLKRLLRDVSSLGVSAIYLTGTELGEKSYRESTLVDRGAARASILDGCMQAGGTAVPVLEMFDSVREAISAVSGQQRILLDVENASSSLFSAPLEPVSAGAPLVLAIGSERGWTAAERILFREAGFKVCSLGSRILRTETAATVSLGIVIAKTGYMEGQ